MSRETPHHLLGPIGGLTVHQLVELNMTGDCFYGMAPGPFTMLARETPDGPWLIDSFNTGP